MVLGVHTPEFEFEKVDNVRRERKNRGVEYPIALDSDYAVWASVRQSLLARALFRGRGGA